MRGMTSIPRRCAFRTTSAPGSATPGQPASDKTPAEAPWATAFSPLSISDGSHRLPISIKRMGAISFSGQRMRIKRRAVRVFSTKKRVKPASNSALSEGSTPQSLPSAMGTGKRKSLPLCAICRKLSSYRGLPTMVVFLMITSFSGRLEGPVLTRSIFSIVLYPSTTSPNTVYSPSKWGVPPSIL